MFIIKKIWSSDITELVSKHSDLGREEVSGCDFIVYKVGKDIIDHLNGDPPTCEQLVKRWPSRKVVFIAYMDIGHVLFSVGDRGMVEIKEPGLIKKIRNYDLDAVLHRKGVDCSIKAPNGGHFVTPSGKHTRVFLRIGDVVNSFNSMDRISYWLQDYIDDEVVGIISDTSSLLSVVVHSLYLKNKNLPFTCLRHTVVGADPNNGLDSVLKKFSNRIPDSGKILIVLSLSMSGESEKAIKDALSTSGVKNETASISIFADERLDSDCMSILKTKIDWYGSRRECDYCNDPATGKIYPIDGGTFFPKIATQNKTTLRVKHFKHVNKHGITEFYKRYGAHPEVFRFHYSDSNDGYSARHHAFYVHVLSLLSNEGFVSEFKARFQHINAERKIDVVVIPPHPAARNLARIAASIGDFNLIEAPFLDSARPMDMSFLNRAEHILFLDDVMISGGRMLSYLRGVREYLAGISHQLTRMTFFPLIVRLESRDKLLAFRESLSRHEWDNKLEFLYEFLLPLWGEGNCPWCREKSILKAYSEDPLSENEWLQDRVELLEDLSNSGIVSGALLHFEGQGSIQMSASSPLVDSGYSEEVALFVLASGLQELRNDAKSPLGNTLLLSNLLCLDTFDKFSDQLIQACLLRATLPDELSPDFYKKLMGSGADEALKKSGPAVLPEVLIKAFSIDSYYAVSDDFFTPFFSSAKANPVVRKLLERIQERY